MNGAEIKTFFENLVSDKPDSVFVYQLLVQAEGRLQRKRDWKSLIKVDSSQSAVSGDIYTSMKPSPADMIKPLKLYVGTTLPPFMPIPFEDRIYYKDSPYFFYVDYLNSQFALTGKQGTSATINLYYKHKPTKIAAGVTPSWMPEEFRPLLAYEAAYIFQGGVEGDAVNFRMSHIQKVIYRELLADFVDYDSDLELGAMNNQGGYADSQRENSVKIGLL